MREFLHSRGTVARGSLHNPRLLQAEPHLASSWANREGVPDELKAAIVLFFSMLDEKQRRLYAGPCRQPGKANLLTAFVTGVIEVTTRISPPSHR